MTRINMIAPQELSDQHLIAEYHELPRVIKQQISTIGASNTYVLGPGHLRWAKKHSYWVINRYFWLCQEMKHRGFQVNYPWYMLCKVYNETTAYDDKLNYCPTRRDEFISRQRIIEKLKLMPTYYTWTNRRVPHYYKKILWAVLFNLVEIL